MIKIPVLLGFDAQKMIGALEIDETRLPPGVGYHFSLGYRALRVESGRITEAKLRCVSVTADENFATESGLSYRQLLKKYLRHVRIYEASAAAMFRIDHSGRAGELSEEERVELRRLAGEPV